MMLSTKSVVFTQNEVFFFAQARRERESYRLQLGIESNMRPRKRATSMKLTTQEYLMPKHLAHQNRTSAGAKSVGSDIAVAYMEAVSDYTKRSLTYEEDRFDAFTGVLNVFAAGHHSLQATQTLSGLLDFGEASKWRCCSLSWFISGTSHRIRRGQVQIASVAELELGRLVWCSLFYVRRLANTLQGVFGNE